MMQFVDPRMVDQTRATSATFVDQERMLSEMQKELQKVYKQTARLSEKNYGITSLDIGDDEDEEELTDEQFQELIAQEIGLMEEGVEEEMLFMEENGDLGGEKKVELEE